jgi:serine phosphatase RsbU (regulator of sigma subunit)
MLLYKASAQNSIKYLKLSKTAYGTNIDSVPIYLNLALASAKEEKNDSIKTEIYVDYINYSGVSSNQHLGDSIFNLAFKATRNKLFLGKLFIAYGYLNKELGNNKKALNVLFKAYGIGQQIKNYYLLCGSTLNIARIYKNEKLYQLSLEYALKSQDFAKKGKLDDRLENIYNLLATLYKIQTEYLKSEEYYFKVKEIVSNNNDKWGLIILNNNLGNLYVEWGKYKEAEKLFEQNLILSKETNNIEMYYYSLFELSSLTYMKNKFPESKIYIDKAMAGMEHLKNKLDLYGIYWQAYLVYKANHQFEQALTFHEQWKAYSDSLTKMSSDKLIFETEAKFKNKEKQEEIKNLESQNLLKEAELSKKNNFLIFSSAFIIVILISLVLLVRFQKKLQLTKHKLELKNIQIEEQKKEILDSIHYAKRIQTALLVGENIMKQRFEEYFILFKPKDIVSGDFYWATELANNNFVLLTADITGHGVPGAIMSMLNISSIEKAVEAEKLIDTKDILNHTRTKIIETLAKDGSEDGGKDGMDCSLISIDENKKTLHYSAANNPIWILRNNLSNLSENSFELIELKPDKMPVGKHSKDLNSFSQNNFELLNGDIIYTLTDGFPDQFGGLKGKKYMYKSLKNKLIEIANLPLSKQKEELEITLSKWKGSYEQVDDILLIGIKI